MALHLTAGGDTGSGGFGLVRYEGEQVAEIAVRFDSPRSADLAAAALQWWDYQVVPVRIVAGAAPDPVAVGQGAGGLVLLDQAQPAARLRVL
jgi:hypothetical protein